MSSERRYSDDEIAAIFREAAEAQKTAQARSAKSEGLTLSELQAIGLDAGITPDFIAGAADAMDRTSVPAKERTLFGRPVSVSRTVDLPGELSDEQWERLVVEIRETFRANGSVKRHGALREWTNGNLKILLEPTETGQRLRMSTTHANAKGGMWSGIGYGGASAFVLVVILANGEFGATAAVLVATLMAMVGAGIFGYFAQKLPRWADERSRQMEHIGTRAVAMVRADEGVSGPPTSEATGRAGIEAEESQPMIELDEAESDAPSTARTRARQR